MSCSQPDDTCPMRCEAELPNTSFSKMHSVVHCTRLLLFSCSLVAQHSRNPSMLFLPWQSGLDRMLCRLRD